MGRKGGRRKKHSSSHEETGSGDEEKIPPQKRRGRPQNLQKDQDSDWEGAEKLEEEEDNGYSVTAENTNSDKYKRKKPNSSEKLDSVEEALAVGMKVKLSTGDNEEDDSVKTNGFRQNGSRRKSKPRRAAEVGTVEWSMDE